jgi:hypothetical protein
VISLAVKRCLLLTGSWNIAGPDLTDVLYHAYRLEWPVCEALYSFLLPQGTFAGPDLTEVLYSAYKLVWTCVLLGNQLLTEDLSRPWLDRYLLRLTTALGHPG